MAQEISNRQYMSTGEKKKTREEKNKKRKIWWIADNLVIYPDIPS